MSSAICYIQVEPVLNSTGSRVIGVKATKLTQNPPAYPDGNAIVVKAQFNVPDEAFLPFRPAVVIDVPLGKQVTESDVSVQVLDHSQAPAEAVDGTGTGEA